MTENAVGEFLAALRKSKGYTQQEVADHLGVSNKTVSSWETGASCPDISMLPALAELYEVTCDEIVRGRRLPAEGEKPARAKREKALTRLLQKQKADLATVCWIAVGLAALGAILTFTVGFAALESLIGFFVGLIAIAASVVTGAVGVRRIRFAAVGEIAGNGVQKFARSLDKAMLLIACADAAAFGLILPHATAPVHTGLDTEWLGGCIACALLGGIVCLLIGIPVCIYRQKTALSFPPEEESAAQREERLRALQAVKLSQWRFRHILLMIALPFAIFSLSAALLAALPSAIYYPMYSYTSFHTTLTSLQTPSGPFASEKYTLLGEQPFEGEEDRWESVFLFEEFPETYRDDYRTEETAEGTRVTVYKYRAAVENTGEYIEFYAYDPELQGGLRSIFALYRGENEPCEVVLEVAPTLPEQREMHEKQNLSDALSWAALAALAAALLSLGIDIPLYIKKERAFRKDPSKKARANKEG